MGTQLVEMPAKHSELAIMTAAAPLLFFSSKEVFIHSASMRGFAIEQNGPAEPAELLHLDSEGIT